MTFGDPPKPVVVEEPKITLNDQLLWNILHQLEIMNYGGIKTHVVGDLTKVE